jgi:hypothetical protein
MDPIDGFYAVYFTSKDGALGAAMIAVVNGKIIGADPTGVRLDGEYEKVQGGYRAKIAVKVPPGTQLVQGGDSGQKGRSYEIEFSFTQKLDDVPFIRIETPLGPLNVKFVKLRDFDV